MEHFPSTLTPEQSDEMVDRMRANWDAERVRAVGGRGQGHRRSSSASSGSPSPGWETHFTPCVEVGWRLAKESWGHGYAPEGALAALECGFAQRRPAARRDRQLHDRRQHEVAPGDGEDRPDATTRPTTSTIRCCPTGPAAATCSTASPMRRLAAGPPESRERPNAGLREARRASMSRWRRSCCSMGRT